MRKYGLFILTIACLVAVVIFAQGNRPAASDTPVPSAQPLPDVAAKPTEEKLPTKAIDYKLYKRDQPGECAWYAAVVRPLDPSNEDYRAYARYVTASIAAKAQTANIIVAIYDNTKAYQLYEIKHIRNRAILNREEMDFVNAHTVGMYTGYLSADPDGAYVLTYYPDCEATRAFRGHEKYRPL